MPYLISTQLWVGDRNMHTSKDFVYNIIQSFYIHHDVFVLLSDGDPKNYMAYYSRATVFLAMGKSKSALPDLGKVIELKPDFTSVSFCIYINRVTTEMNKFMKQGVRATAVRQSVVY